MVIFFFGLSFSVLIGRHDVSLRRTDGWMVGWIVFFFLNLHIMLYYRTCITDVCAYSYRIHTYMLYTYVRLIYVLDGKLMVLKLNNIKVKDAFKKTSRVGVLKS